MRTDSLPHSQWLKSTVAFRNNGSWIQITGWSCTVCQSSAFWHSVQRENLSIKLQHGISHPFYITFFLASAYVTTTLRLIISSVEWCPIRLSLSMWTINSTICFHQLQLSRSCDPAVSGWTVSFQDILAPLHEVLRLKTQLRVCLVFAGTVAQRYWRDFRWYHQSVELGHRDHHPSPPKTGHSGAGTFRSPGSSTWLLRAAAWALQWQLILTGRRLAPSMLWMNPFEVERLHYDVRQAGGWAKLWCNIYFVFLNFCSCSFGATVVAGRAEWWTHSGECMQLALRAIGA